MFNIRELKRRYPADDDMIKRLVGNDPYIEFDEPIDVEMKILGDECVRSIGLVTARGVVYAQKKNSATYCSLGFEALWHGEWHKMYSDILKWAEELDEEQKSKGLETIGEDDMLDI
jgi:hypothetical protein